MIKVAKILPLFFFLLLSISCFSQDLLFNVQFFDQRDGLSTRNIYSVNQDDRGLIWVGTANGLNQFDGQTFKLIGDQNSKTASGRILGIEKSRDGNFWIQKEGEQVINFNPYKGEVIPLDSDEDFGYLRMLNSSFHTNNIWLRNGKGGLYHLDENLKIQSFGKGNYPLTDNMEGMSWGNVLLSNPSANRKVEINSLGDTVRILKNIEWYRRLYDQGAGQIYFNSSNSKTNAYLSKLALGLGENRALYPLEFKKDNQPIRVIDLGVPSLSKCVLIRDNKENHWLIGGNKVYFFDKDGNLQKELVQELLDLSINTWSTNDVLIDDHNRLWIATGLGLYLIEVKENPFQLYLEESGKTSIRAMTMLSDNELLVCNYHGTKIIDTQTEEIIYHFKDVFGLGLSKMKDNIIWSGQHNSTVIELNTSTKTVIRKGGGELIRGVQVYVPFYDKDIDSVYIGTDKGLYMSNVAGTFFKKYDQLNGFNELTQTGIFYFYKNREGLWIVTQSGLFLLDEERGILNQYNFPYNAMNHIYEDSIGDFWIGTQGGGLIHWDRRNDIKRQYTVKDGLSDNYIYAVYEDEDNYLWLPSNYGLMRFEKLTGEVINFQEEDGIADQEFNTHAHYQSKDGRLYLGGINGLTAFYPREVISSKNDAPLIITKFEQLDGESGELTNKTKNLLATNEIILNPDDKFFSIHFSLLDYTARDIIYAWKIEGFDNDWNYVKENSIRINALSYGDYTLQIKAKGTGGQWAKSNLVIPIRALPPFYLKPQFIELRRRAETLSREVFQRTQTIRKQNNQLEEANQFKDKVLALVAHDLRAPLITLKGLTRKINFLLQKDRIDDVFKLSNTIDNSTDSVTVLLDNIMNWALIQRGQFDIKPTSLELKLLVKEVIDIYKNTAEAKTITLLGLEESLQAVGDKNALLTVLRNVLNNAIKYTNDGGEISFSGAIKGEEVWLEVKDTGIGMPAERIKNIFDFDRKKRLKGTKGEKGTGFGLMLCKELMTLNDGNILVESDLGKGSSFFVILPATRHN